MVESELDMPLLEPEVEPDMPDEVDDDESLGEVDEVLGGVVVVVVVVEPEVDGLVAVPAPLMLLPLVDESVEPVVPEVLPVVPVVPVAFDVLLGEVLVPAPWVLLAPSPEPVEPLPDEEPAPPLCAWAAPRANIDAMATRVKLLGNLLMWNLL